MSCTRKTGVLLLFVILAATFWLPALRSASQPGREVVFYYSNDVHGETEPCG